MLSLVTPHLHLASILDLGLPRIRELGLDALLLDVDCTLKDHGASEFPAAVHEWSERLRAGGVRLCLLSNGRSRRIGRLAQQLDLPFVARAFKPLPLGCLVGLKKLGVPRARAAMVGDQIFADVMAGRLAGLFTILVRPTSPVEPWFTRLKRPVERRVLRWINIPGQSDTHDSALHRAR
jgi:HAD superfamily phosphatase (TIGR01668 family)